MGMYFYIAKLSCRDFVINEANDERCWDVATAPNNDGNVEDLSIRIEGDVKYLYAKVNGDWEKVAEVPNDFVLPDLNDVYITENYQE